MPGDSWPTGSGGLADQTIEPFRCKKVQVLSWWSHFHRGMYFALRLEKALITADDLKRFCAELCCESYPNTETMDEDVAAAEKHWPKFSEMDEAASGQPVRWGSDRIGRLPPFIWKDTGLDYGCLHSSPDQHRHLLDVLHLDANAWRLQYEKCLQTNQVCVLHSVSLDFVCLGSDQTLFAHGIMLGQCCVSVVWCGCVRDGVGCRDWMRMSFSCVALTGHNSTEGLACHHTFCGSFHCEGVLLRFSTTSIRGAHVRGRAICQTHAKAIAARIAASTISPRSAECILDHLWWYAEALLSSESSQRAVHAQQLEVSWVYATIHG